MERIAFAQLTKVDEKNRLVYGRAVQETPDRVGEIFDYASSKPMFEAWSKSQSDASMGKSIGNVRAMHKDISAGIIVPGGMVFHDDERAIDLCAKVSDDNEWQKVLDGCYTGFSIGGRYANKWEDTELKKTRYTADPSEVSLVDRPCVPTATFFEIQKADGSVMQKNFVEPTATDEAVDALTKIDYPLHRNQMIKALMADGGNLDEIAGMTDDELAKAHAAKFPPAVVADDLAKNLIDAKNDDGAAQGADEETVAECTAAETAMLAEADALMQETGEFTKGDFPGHPFHGNQYTSGESGAAVHASQKARGNETRTNHKSAASAHRAAAKAAEKSGHAKTAEYHSKMAAFHTSRAGAAKKSQETGNMAKADEETQYEVAGSDNDVAEFAKVLNEGKLSMRDAIEALRKVAAREDVSPKEGERKYGSVKFADAKNKKYPIDSAEHIKAAWNYINKGKNADKYSAEDLKSIKAAIIAAWKDKIDKEGPPSAAKADAGDLQKADVPLRKGLYICSQFAQLVQALAGIAESVEYEAAAEDDGSPLPALLNAALSDLGSILVQMVQEEVDELTHGEEVADIATVPAMAMSQALGDMVKRLEPLRKAPDFQKMHDESVAGGAKCATKKADSVETVDDALAKQYKESNDVLAKSLGEAADTIKKLAADVEMLKAQPMPSKARLMVVTKGQELADESVAEAAVQPVFKKDGSVDEVTTALKKIHQTGGVPVRLR